ncbi:MAG TPA: TfoX/Sxy family protein [Acidimicrobiales bacterium]|jgi:TfoX/Sxy family transcriptional regulator of competence genes|nr:TfoX/Sxy family protein [Acidimicrobiales bacterium]
MASDKRFVERTLEKLLPLDVSAKPMFGEYGVYFKGKLFGLICNDTLFIKTTDAGSDVAGRISKAPPYPGAKPAFKISPARLNDHEWLSRLVEVTTNELPNPKKKAR